MDVLKTNRFLRSSSCHWGGGRGKNLNIPAIYSFPICFNWACADSARWWRSCRDVGRPVGWYERVLLDPAAMLLAERLNKDLQTFLIVRVPTHVDLGWVKYAEGITSCRVGSLFLRELRSVLGRCDVWLRLYQSRSPRPKAAGTVQFCECR